MALPPAYRPPTLVGDDTTGRAVVIDPQRDVSQYLADAEAEGLHIERVIETHVHADFLSGHLELAEATGAVISYGSVVDPPTHTQGACSLVTRCSSATSSRASARVVVGWPISLPRSPESV